MATKASKVANKDDDSAKVNKNLNNWKFPKVSVNTIYKKQPFRFFPNFTIKDSEKTETSISARRFHKANLIRPCFLKSFIKNKHTYLHLGLVQVAVKPLVRDGLDAPIIVCLRDVRDCNPFKNSLLAVVEANLSQGAFYFDCFPSFSVAISDVDSSFDEVLTLSIRTSGVPVALTVRRVFKAMKDLSPDYLKEPMIGETTYVHATSGTSATTHWDDFLHDDSFYSNLHDSQTFDFILD